MKRSLLLAIIICFGLSVTGVNAQKKRKTAPVKKPTPVVNTAPEEWLVETKQQAAFKPGPPDKDGWSLYESSDDHFKVAFPPTPVVTDMTDEYGKKDGNRYYNPEPVTPARISLTLMVTPLGMKVADDNFKRELYNGWIEGVMANDGSGKKAVKVSAKEFAVAGSFGMDVVVDREDFRFHGRIICPADKCYQLAVGSASPRTAKVEEYAEIEKWKQKFFDSLQIIQPPPAPPDPFYGKTVGGIYINDVLNFSMAPPVGWHAGDVQDRALDKDLAREILKGDNKYYNQLLDENLKVERIVARYMRKPEGSAANASMGLSAMKLQPDKANLVSNAAATRKMLQSGNLAPTVDPVQYKYFGKNRAAILNITTNYNGLQIRQRLYLVHHRGYGISITLSYLDEMDLLMMEKSLLTLKFK